MAHDEAALGQSLEKPRKQRGKIRIRIEIVDAGKGRIGRYAARRGAAAKAAAELAQGQRLEVPEQDPQRQRAAALPHPGGRRGAFRRGEGFLAELRKQMHVLMAVEEVGRAPERGRE